MEAERYVAIDNVCAWPNLTVLPDGAIAATIFNQPNHGRTEGDVDVWASTDGGRMWRRRGVAAPHEPGKNRMNVAAGRNHAGDLLVIASGWEGRAALGSSDEAPGKRDANSVLHPWLCRSSDGGVTWTLDRDGLPERPADDMYRFIPFGDIVPADDRLGVTLYSTTVADASYRQSTSYFSHSLDDGLTWSRPVPIANDANETALHYLGDKAWLAVCRTAADAHLEAFRSDDHGATWKPLGPVSLPSQHPAHILGLPDGRLLLTYGNRCPDSFGVDVRLSKDAGASWSAPRALIRYPAADSGYPASVLNQQGQVVTAYYASSEPHHHRYHMGVAIWNVE